VCKGGFESVDVGSAVAGADVVGEGEDGFGVHAGGPAEGYFDGYRGCFVVGGGL